MTESGSIAEHQCIVADRDFAPNQWIGSIHGIPFITRILASGKYV
jgi:hypothetical protein